MYLLQLQYGNLTLPFCCAVAIQMGMYDGATNEAATEERRGGKAKGNLNAGSRLGNANPKFSVHFKLDRVSLLTFQLTYILQPCSASLVSFQPTDDFTSRHTRMKSPSL